MTKPTIHMNGTSAAVLLVHYREAMRNIREAAEALNHCAPNGRDYYPQGDGALAQAQAEHRARYAALQAAYHELEQLAVHCQEQL